MTLQTDGNYTGTAVVNDQQLPPQTALPGPTATTTFTINGHTPTSRPGRIICIAGFAESTREMANREPPEVEIWSLNRCHTFLKRWDRWFEIHLPELYEGKTGLREAEYLGLLRKWGGPVYMQHPSDVLPNIVVFPKQDIIRCFGVENNNPDRDYFTTSIAYMLALALYEHRQGQTVSEIRMYGVDMSAYTEYSYQLPCVNTWLGVAIGLGVRVTIPRQSPVLKGPAYGDHAYKWLWENFKDRIVHHKAKQAEGAANLQAVTGAHAEMERIVKAVKELRHGSLWSQGIPFWKVDELLGVLQQRSKELGKFHSQLNADLNAVIGALREAQHSLVVINAPQSEAEEPEPVKLPTV